MITADKELLIQVWKETWESLLAFGMDAYPENHVPQAKCYEHALISDDTMDDVNALVVGMKSLIDLVRGDLDFADWLLEPPDQWYGLEDPRSLVGIALVNLRRLDEAREWDAYLEHRWDDQMPMPPIMVSVHA